MSMERTFSQNFAVRSLGTPGQWSAAAQYAEATWIDTATFRRIVILPHAGELDADMALKVYEADDTAGTNAQEVDATNLSDSFVNGTDEGLPGIMEFDTAALAKRYVNLQVTPGAADGYAGLILLYRGTDRPETNTVGTHVAFNNRVETQ